MTESIERDIVEFAHVLADAAGEIVRAAARSRRIVHRKADASPVTEVDRAVEMRLREMIAARYPDHGVVGEEFADEPAGGRARLGARPHRRHQGVHGRFAGIRHPDRAHPRRTPRARSHRPAHRPRALDGNRRRRDLVQRRACPHQRMQSARRRPGLHHLSSEYYEGEDARAFRRIVSRSKWMVYGGNCHAFAQVACGLVDVALEAKVGVYDYCALVSVVENAGGVMTGWRGEPLTLEPTPGGRILASGNREVHEAALACLAGES